MRLPLGDPILAFLQLVRLPNVFTAMADVLAGYFIVAAPRIAWSDILGLTVSSSALYAGGCVLNDLCDWELDARERPFRPLPSARVAPWAAFSLLLALFTAGLWAARSVGAPAFVLAILLAALIVSYDVFAKSHAVLGPLNMAACRSCNLMLGMSGGLPVPGTAMLFPLLTLAYVFSLTTLSRFEVNDPLEERGWVVAAGWLGVIGALLGLALGGSLSRNALAPLALLVLCTGPALWAALREPSPARIGAAVKWLILGIPLLDAVYVAGAQGWCYALIVSGCIAPAVLTARRLYVT